MILSWRTGAAALLILTLGGCACGKARAAAADPIMLGQFKDWAAFTYKAPDTKVCYVAARPKTSLPAKIDRKPAFFLVTNFPGRNVHGQVSIMPGYAYKKGSTAVVTIDAKSFTFYTKDDTAWADTPETEKAIVDALKSGHSVAVKGTSWKNTQTIDTFSLDGVSAAIAKSDDACK
jgi:hypothetical protein